MAEEYKRMRQLVGSEADWATNDLVIGDGEIAFERDSGVIRAKLGDGATPFASLPWFTEALWQSSGSYTFNRVDGPVIVGATSGPDRLTVRGGNYSMGAYLEGIPTSGLAVGILKFGALEATNTPVQGASMRAETTEDWSPTQHGTKMRFLVTPNGAIQDVSVGIIEQDGGLVWGTGTGGTQGAGTINCKGIYVDGVDPVAALRAELVSEGVLPA